MGEEAIVRRLIDETLELPPGTVLATDRLVETLGLHALDLVLIVLKIEEETGAAVDLDALSGASTVEGLEEVVRAASQHNRRHGAVTALDASVPRTWRRCRS